MSVSGGMCGHLLNVEDLEKAYKLAIGIDTDFIETTITKPIETQLCFIDIILGQDWFIIDNGSYNWSPFQDCLCGCLVQPILKVFYTDIIYCDAKYLKKFMGLVDKMRAEMPLIQITVPHIDDLLRCVNIISIS